MVINDSLVLCLNPLKTVGLEVVKNENSGNPADFVWDEIKQQLLILKWPEDKTDLHVRIVPGITGINN
ncbi:MAG: hypothetical protein EP310_09425 [Bacteroidetes bacterium]|nr:MAG: hypothetical protein EP310_09425 [Bacteroidota bacterium]